MAALTNTEALTRLSLVESCGGHVDVEHHLPLRRPHRLVEAEPDLPAAAEGMVVAVRRREEAAADGGVGHGGQVTHHHVQGLDGVERYLSRAAFQGLLEGVERDLFGPLDRDAEHPISAFSGQGDFELDSFVSYWQWVPGVHVVAAVEDRLPRSEYSSVGLDHRLDDVPVDLSGTLVRLDADLVVVDVASRHGNLEVVGTQENRATVATDVRPSRADEGRCIGERWRAGAEPETEAADR